MFANLQIATVGFIMSICPLEQIGFQQMGFCEILYWEILLKSVKEIHMWLKLVKNVRNFT